MAWIVRNQFARRSLTAMQRAELALKLKDADDGEDTPTAYPLLGYARSDSPLSLRAISRRVRS